MACPGRLGGIFARVRFLFNQTGLSGPIPGDENEEELLGLLNLMVQDLAARDAWIKLASFDSAANEPSYDLKTHLPDYFSLLNLNWKGTGTVYRELVALPNWQKFQTGRELVYSSGTPATYWVETGELFVWPAPSVTATDAFQVRYSYLPD